MHRRTFLGLAGSGALALTSGRAFAARPDLMDLAAATPDLSVLVTALTAAGMTGLLKEAGPYTVFAPTDAAFAKLPAGTLDHLLLPENRGQLVAVLSNHIVNRKLTILSMIEKTQDLPNIAGRMLRTTANMDVNVNGVHVIQPELLASNGVIQRIGEVLLPKT